MQGYSCEKEVTLSRLCLCPGAPLSHCVSVNQGVYLTFFISASWTETGFLLPSWPWRAGVGPCERT